MKRTQHIAYFKVPYKQKDNDNYQNNDNFCCGDKKSSKGDGITDNEDPELNQFYYHSDHLGSSSYITNLKGSIVQHVEYVPFGEVFLEERNNKWNTPYLFNGKELDEETGLYYYGARYYNSRNSLWLSVDPLAEKYPGISPYCYTLNNPVKFIDPDGREVEITDYRNNKGELLYKTKDNLNDVIIVYDINRSKLENKLKEAYKKGNINDPEFNKKELHKLGQTPNKYSEKRTKGMGDYWEMGYKETYPKAYKKETSQFSLGQIFSSIISAIATENEDKSGEMRHGGRVSGILEGNYDRKKGNINRLNPYSSFKNNSPKINFNKKNKSFLPYPGIGLPPK